MASMYATSNTNSWTRLVSRLGPRNVDASGLPMAARIFTVASSSFFLLRSTAQASNPRRASSKLV
eukprot:11717653-Prorocentrum_lima.AAC.1